ncbi:hypothetical protein CANCADRAFT_2551 [Tortispora caseinolytica NRRL Y-17796]|uniref:Importin N-terminal domain-containing protein n=1 Tax=Tortispora caseinolytica NRRL Y-17796 TaxID=767744 RepID=A0A1E4TGF5_9ASCO|nr:hypothetical protein CANCADRAFT_2551 [Tortispora caseinolytica NRRL Y-17796]
MWTPNQSSLESLTNALSQSLARDANVRRQAQSVLDGYLYNPELPQYLCFIFIQSDQSLLETRATAGTFLKNLISSSFASFTDLAKSYIKTVITKGLLDTTPLIRNITGNVLTSIIRSGGILSWPELFPLLISLAESNELSVQEAALSSLEKISEDNAAELDKSYGNEQPSAFMIPKFIALLSRPSSSNSIKKYSIACINYFAALGSSAVFLSIDQILSTLFQIAQQPDSDPAIQSEVCVAFTTFLQAFPANISPHLDGLVNYCLHVIATNAEIDDQSFAALSAGEFFITLASANSDRLAITQLLPQIIPVLFKHMPYSEEEQEEILAEHNAIEENPQNVRPSHIKSRDAKSAPHQNSSEQSQQEAEDDDEEDDDDFEDEVGEWTLRRCCASALDSFSNKYPENVIEILMPLLLTAMNASDWPTREASILAFGAVSEGCLNFISPQLPELIAYLIQLLDTAEPPVQQIACWTLSRYTPWIIRQSEQGFHDVYYKPMVNGILKCFYSRSRNVQTAAVGAIATIIEKSSHMFISCLPDVLQGVHYGLANYKRSSIRAIYDIIVIICDYLSYAVATPEFVNQIVPLIIQQWNQLSKDDTLVFLILDAYTALSGSLGPVLGGYGPEIFKQCHNLLQESLVMSQHAMQDPTAEEPDIDLIIASLDALDGFVRGYQDQAADLFALIPSPSYSELILMCTEYGDPDVRQSAFGAIGDAALYCYSLISDNTAQLMEATIKGLDYNSDEEVAAVNNAVWALGELSLHVGSDIQKQVPTIYPKLLKLLLSSDLASLKENAAITLSRLGAISAPLIAPHLKDFAKAWCDAMTYVADSEEKESAYRGMCVLIAENPHGLESALLPFLTAIAHYGDPGSLFDTFRTVIQGYKNMIPGFNEQLLANLQPDIVSSIEPYLY